MRTLGFIALTVVCGLSLMAGVLPMGFKPTPLYGLVSRWMLNEGSGTVASDISGLAHPGNLTNSPTWTTGIAGTGLAFDGSAAMRVDVASSYVISSSSPFTVCGWVKVTNFTANQYQHVLTVQTDTGKPFELTVSSGGAGYEGVLIGSSTTWVRAHDNSPTATFTGGWCFIACTYNGSAAGTLGNFATYTNGIATTLVSSSGFSDLANLTSIGAPVSGGTANKVFGSVDDVRIYNRALSAAEIRQLYNGGASTHQ